MQRSWEFSNPFSGNFLFVSLDLSEPGTFPQVTQETFKFLNCCLLKGWTWEGASPLLPLVFVFFPKAFAAGFGVVSRWVFVLSQQQQALCLRVLFSLTRGWAGV